jgi:hypothetical protein
VHGGPFPRPWALVEVAPDAAGQLRDAVIRAAYLLSRQGLVALALGEVSRARVDAVLDQVVASTPGGVHGVIYMETDDHGPVLEAARNASLVVATTDAFRHRLALAGIAVTGDAEAAAILHAAEFSPRPPPPAPRARARAAPTPVAAPRQGWTP